MTHADLMNLLRLAERDGADAALAHFETHHAFDEDAAREGEIDSLMAEREDAHGDYADNAYRYGCGADDTVDSKGRPLRPLVNDAGEPWWF